MTALRGAAILKARGGCKNRLNSKPLVLPIQLDNNKFDDDFDFEKCRLALAMGTVLTIETDDGMKSSLAYSRLLFTQIFPQLESL